MCPSSIKNAFAFSVMTVVGFSASACSSHSTTDRSNAHSGDASSNLNFSAYDIRELNALAETDALFFLLFVPDRHPATQMHKAELRKMQSTASEGLGVPAVAVSYVYAVSSPDTDLLREWSPDLRIPKDPTLVVFKNREELARRWLGREPLSEAAEKLLSQLEHKRIEEQLGQTAKRGKEH